MTQIVERARRLLENWAQAAEAYWNPCEDDSRLGNYGPGYIHWGVQSNWNYMAAMATLAAQPGVGEAEQWRERALAALRFALATHLSGGRATPDGKNWGHGWISMLGIERGMHGVDALEPYLSEEDRAALRRVLTSEANWLLKDFHYKGQAGIQANVWNSSGQNAPEFEFVVGEFAVAHGAAIPGRAQRGGMARTGAPIFDQQCVGASGRGR